MSLTWGNVPEPLPFNHTASGGKLGEGLGTRQWMCMCAEEGSEERMNKEGTSSSKSSLGWYYEFDSECGSDEERYKKGNIRINTPGWPLSRFTCVYKEIRISSARKCTIDMTVPEGTLHGTERTRVYYKTKRMRVQLWDRKEPFSSAGSGCEKSLGI